MTSSNGDGHEPKGGKSSHTPRHDVFFPPEATPPALTSQVVNTAGAHAVPVSGGEPSIAGLALPAEFNTGHFLDPAFLAGLANELYDVGRAPVEPGASSVRPEMLMQGVPMALPDTCLLEKMAHDFLPTLGVPSTAIPAMPALPTGMPSPGAVPAMPTSMPAAGLPGATEGFYFLQQAMTPPSVPAVAPPIPAVPANPPGISTSFAPASVRPEMLLQGEPMAFQDALHPEKTPSDFAPTLGMPSPAVPPMPAVPALPTATPSPSGVPAMPTSMPAAGLPGATESFYFLQQASPPTVPLQAPPTPADPTGYGAFYFLQPPTSAPAVPTTPASPLAPRQFDVEAIRQDFPILHQTVHGKPLIWFDNAATTQKPRQVIQALARFYERDNSNVHRAAHALAARATNAFEEAREKVRRFLGAAQVEEIVFVRGCTEGINLIAQSYGRKFIGPGDEIVLSQLEHHSNIVPWHQLAKEKGAVLKVVPVNDRGEILLDEYERLLGPRTKLVSLTHVSNALGTVLPVQTMTKMARRHGAVVVLDGAQSVPHLSVDVQSLDCDFYVFSGHKLFGPTGVGAVYGRRELLEAMPPWQGGGNMIDQVTFEQVTYQPPPMKFEAGTGILAGAVGLGAAIDYVEQLGMENIHRHEHELLVHATSGLGAIPGLRLIGTAAEKASVVSFVLDGVRTEDMGRYLDREGIAVRAGHHCAQPALRRFGLTSSVRPSLAFYNTHAEVDTLVAAVRRAKATL